MSNATNSLLAGLVVMLVVSGVFALANLSIRTYNDDMDFGSGGVTILNNYGDLNTSTVKTFSDDDLPDSEDSVSAESGSIFTDMFKTTKNWVMRTTGLQYLVNIVGAPVILLSGTGIPAYIIAIIGMMWYGIFVFLIISWLLGK